MVHCTKGQVVYRCLVPARRCPANRHRVVRTPEKCQGHRTSKRVTSTLSKVSAAKACRIGLRRTSRRSRDIRTTWVVVSGDLARCDAEADKQTKDIEGALPAVATGQGCSGLPRFTGEDPEYSATHGPGCTLLACRWSLAPAPGRKPSGINAHRPRRRQCRTSHRARDRGCRSTRNARRCPNR